MRDYRFFFLAGFDEGLKTSDLFHVEQLTGTFVPCFTWNKKTKPGEPGVLFHVEQSPPYFDEGVVRSFQD